MQRTLHLPSFSNPLNPPSPHYLILPPPHHSLTGLRWQGLSHVQNQVLSPFFSDCPLTDDMPLSSASLSALHVRLLPAVGILLKGQRSQQGIFLTHISFAGRPETGLRAGVDGFV